MEPQSAELSFRAWADLLADTKSPAAKKGLGLRVRVQGLEFRSCTAGLRAYRIEACCKKGLQKGFSLCCRAVQALEECHQGFHTG